ncbi:cell division protein FtsZ [Vannielia litorea]|uniref:cell division protein FtsZ n=1 Tax=Vannielia litorea TaxID=1217970 RepID=UPI001C964B5F|nr:cell division protein FtsZ [Vannielia litorea]MBY6046823.1 cell division protein FtsZ [Vannielia litorea]MBY6074237.1 cell division protein FtsZ [Vannielia litorea]
MTLNLTMPTELDLKPRITVFGVGGAGGNAVNNMIEKQLEGVEFVVANTDAQALQQSAAANRIQMGVKVTEGLGAGARPTVGAAAAEETIEEIIDHLAGAHMCFITAGMGGGTGTGAAPIIAQAARELGVLTVGVVTKPFQFEGGKRMRQAEEGVEALQKVVDTLIIIPNQNLFRLANEKTTFTEAFALADDVLYQGVKGVTDLMVRPGLINLDFADVRAVMDEMGKAMMGTGEAEGEDRAKVAAQKAIANPLLDEISLNGAKGVLINITGGHDLTLFELDEAANEIREKVDSDANIIVGSTLDTGLEGFMRVSVVATGIDVMDEEREIPVPRRSMAAPLPQQSAEPEAAPAPAPMQEVAAAPQVSITGARPAEPQPQPAAPAPQAEAEEPSLFPAFRSSARDEAEVAGDDLPPPAYRPAAEAQPLEAVEQPEPAPAARPAPGTPSAEALARLHQAVRKVPGAHTGAPAEQPRAAAPAPQPQAQPEQQPAAAASADHKARFGIGSLITRMAGHGAEGQPQQPAHREPPVRSAATQPQRSAYQQPQMDHEEEVDPEQERIEIPAFLRRQAN